MGITFKIDTENQYLRFAENSYLSWTWNEVHNLTRPPNNVDKTGNCFKIKRREQHSEVEKYWLLGRFGIGTICMENTNDYT